MPALSVERRGQVAYLTIDRPPLNVLDIATLNELSASLEHLVHDEPLRALVLSGAGRGFSAGVDIADHTLERVPAMLEAVSRAIKTLYQCPVPTLALLHGQVLGGGLELALACDMIVAHEEARLGLPEIKLGVFAPYAALLLPPLVGRQNALRLLYSGEAITAEEAARMGLVQLVLRGGDETPLLALLETLQSRSATALRLTKRAVEETLGLSLDQALTRVNQLYCDTLMQTPDAHEGLAAFMEKRAPRWQHDL